LNSTAKPLLFFAVLALGFIPVQIAGCGSPESSLPKAKSAAIPALPPELDGAAQKLMGPNVRVLLSGDLAHNGRRQILLLDPGPGAVAGSASGVAFWRAAVLEKQDNGWAEVLRCDEYLKNSSGYLRGTPREPVSGWQLQVGSENKKWGQELSFTPLQVQSNEPVPTIQVRWNANVRRYQSVDATTQQFLAELPLLEAPATELKR
jgi:hypothetical protein